MPDGRPVTGLRALFLSPHNDDETLFGAFTLLRERPFVIIVLRSRVQELRGLHVTAAAREAETDAAMRILGCDWQQWPFPDDVADWAAVEAELVALRDRYDRVYAPAPEEPDQGHAHHDALGYIAARVFGPERVTHYRTYTRHGGRSRQGEKVPFTPAWVELKLRALACYRSQMAVEGASAYPHFMEGLTEFYAR